MLDDFLNDDDEIRSFLEEIEEEDQTISVRRQPETGFMGMTPFQRFVVSVLFLLMVLITGSFCLLITGSISLPL